MGMCQSYLFIALVVVIGRGGMQSSSNDDLIYGSVGATNYLCECGEGITMSIMCPRHMLDLDLFQGFFLLLNRSLVGHHAYLFKCKVTVNLL